MNIILKLRQDNAAKKATTLIKKYLNNFLFWIVKRLFIDKMIRSWQQKYRLVQKVIFLGKVK
jgi:hypothetical protein